MENQQFLDVHGLNILVSEILEKMEGNGKVIPFENKLLFPSIGKENVIYIDQANDEVYRWDDENIKYFKVGNNYENIKIINGGNAIQ